MTTILARDTCEGRSTQVQLSAELGPHAADGAPWAPLGHRAIYRGTTEGPLRTLTTGAPHGCAAVAGHRPPNSRFRSQTPAGDPSPARQGQVRRSAAGAGQPAVPDVDKGPHHPARVDMPSGRASRELRDEHPGTADVPAGRSPFSPITVPLTGPDLQNRIPGPPPRGHRTAIAMPYTCRPSTDRWTSTTSGPSGWDGCRRGIGRRVGPGLGPRAGANQRLQQSGRRAAPGSPR